MVWRFNDLRSEIDGAVALLRDCGSGAWLCHCAGAFPFAFCFLYGIGTSGIDRHASRISLGLLMAVSYILYKTCQALGARLMMSAKSGGPWLSGPGELLGIAARQAIFQPWLMLLGMLLFPLWPWLHGLSLHVTVGNPGTQGMLRWMASQLKRTLQDALSLPLLCLLLCPLYGIMLLNIGVVLFMLPYAARTLLGIESVFTAHAAGFFNLQTLVTLLFLSYMSVELLWTALAVNDAYRKDTFATGLDIVSRARRMMARDKARTLGVLVAGCLLLCSASMGGQEDASRFAKEADRILEDAKYAWVAPDDGTALARLEAQISARLRRLLLAIESLMDYIRKFFGTGGADGRVDGRRVVKDVLYICCVAAIVILCAMLAIYAFKLGRQLKRTGQAAPLPPPVPKAPDLDSGYVAADMLSGGGWGRLAEELEARGEYRKAMRAWFLAHTAILGARRCIGISREKGNRDYVNEVGRHSGTGTRLFSDYRSSVRLFEGVWYGDELATADGVESARQLARRSENLPIRDNADEGRQA